MYSLLEVLQSPHLIGLMYMRRHNGQERQDDGTEMEVHIIIAGFCSILTSTLSLMSVYISEDGTQLVIKYCIICLYHFVRMVLVVLVLLELVMVLMVMVVIVELVLVLVLVLVMVMVLVMVLVLVLVVLVLLELVLVMIGKLVTVEVTVEDIPILKIWWRFA